MARASFDVVSAERTMTRSTLLQFSAAAAGGVALGLPASAPAHGERRRPAHAYSADVPAAWFDLALDLVRTTPGFSPPVASRAFGYAGLTLHKSIAPGTRRHHDRGSYHWPLVANTALASILRSLFPTTSGTNLAAIDALEERLAAEARAMLPRGTYRRSTERGAWAAARIFEWSKSDGGHEGYLRNFLPYSPPSGPGLWVPTPPAFQSALQPTWGTNRPFVRRSGRACDPGPPPRYSEQADSRFFREGEEVYLAVNNRTAEEEAIARFWSDDPGQTSTPPGHWISILTQVVRQRDIQLDRAAEAYAAVGIAVTDAFIACWRTKYRYNLLRPVTCIRNVIDPGWTPLLTTPPFPEYTSGHSVQSAAAARVLTNLLGRVSFTDRTHEARGLPARSFDSFRDAADEAAESRLLGGIHFRAAIERGLEQGDCLGRQVSGLFRR